MSSSAPHEYSLVEDEQMPVTIEDVSRHLVDIWKVIQSNSGVHTEAAAAGIDLNDIVNEPDSPFTARKDEGFGVVPLILIAASGRIVGDLGMRGLDWLWENVVLPRLSALTGLHPPEDDAA
jgi:hypothetical protein